MQVLLGYPPEKISLLTMYNGQKELLQDILSQRCGPNTPLAGMRPGAVSTVDQYQGQQNDYVILSLVRTTAVGHVRDVRRMIVAVSRARLGLYILGRKTLFDSCHELNDVMSLLDDIPSQLQLIKNEKYPVERQADGVVPAGTQFGVEDVTALGGIVHSMQEELCL
jgi:intron-binding protein aquarius